MFIKARVMWIVVAVVLLHVLIGYALVLAVPHKDLHVMTKPLEAVVIRKVLISAPSTPPPRKPQTLAPTPQVKPSPSPLAQNFAPPAAVAPQVANPAPVTGAVTAAPAPGIQAPVASLTPAPVVAVPPRPSIGLICPTQVQPEMPRRALKEGIEGVVKAQIHVKGSRILDVTILSGPRVFHAAVREAMLQYSCLTDGGEVIAAQEFTFKLE